MHNIMITRSHFRSGQHGVRMLFLGALAQWAVVAASSSAHASARIISGNTIHTDLLHPLSPQKRSRHLGLIASVRGGSADPSGAATPPQYRPPDYQIPPPQQQQQQQQDALYQPPPSSPQEENVPFAQEAFQERIDTWRNYQMEHAEEQRSSLSPRDDLGRLKLLTSIGKGSRAITFFLLMWRNVHLYEVVDAKYKGNLRFMGVLPLTLLFVANMAGVVASLSSTGHSSKKRLKAILNLNKLVEIFLIIWNIGNLLFTTSNLMPREIYISHILHSVFFIMQCQAVTRFVWNEAVPVSTAQSMYPENEVDGDDQFIQQEPMDPYGGMGQDSGGYYSNNQRPSRY